MRSVDVGSDESAAAILNDVPKKSRTSRKNCILSSKSAQATKNIGVALTSSQTAHPSDSGQHLHCRGPLVAGRVSDDIGQRNLHAAPRQAAHETPEVPYLRVYRLGLKLPRRNAARQSSTPRVRKGHSLGIWESINLFVVYTYYEEALTFRCLLLCKHPSVSRYREYSGSGPNAMHQSCD